MKLNVSPHKVRAMFPAANIGNVNAYGVANSYILKNTKLAHMNISKS